MIKIKNPRTASRLCLKDRTFSEKDNFKTIEDIEYAFALQTKGGQETSVLLGRILPSLFLKIPFEKTMKWGNKEIRYARPIIHYFCFFDGKHICFEDDTGFWKNIPYSEILLSDFVSQKEIKLAKATDYSSVLRSHSIEVNAASRKKAICRSLVEEATKESLHVDLDETLLQEVNFLVEKPKIIMAEFDKSFIDMPELIITTEMKEHQRYFPLRDKKK